MFEEEEPDLGEETSEIRIKASTALNPQNLVPSGTSKAASAVHTSDTHHFGVAVDLKAGVTTIDCSAESQSVVCQDNVVPEPFIGMEFESEYAAKEFYDYYARRVGFIMRIDQCRRSEVDKRILSRRLSCNKQGYYVKMKNHHGPPRKARTSTREGCKAMMLVKVNKSDKWVVTRFVKEHTHQLVPSGCSSGNAMDKKDRRIQELSMELEHQDKLCDLYREQLVTFLENVEQQMELLSKKIQVAVNNVKEVEAEVQKQPNSK
ncbi:protein FAR1-RELATED SEQUENCE 2-like isoform X1 [Solanum pennellii]|uniref:Protein FAR1-RELATED SEQUENCE 2-like isoform X1 n=1 Tax=Solanum pennellii TaxID=28526 RepID=A0ABM1UVW6_SOLPN|nr:protein FAR1-RELATED SEQUENCE 2-like isoform X1 [Solanum pennellii]